MAKLRANVQYKIDGFDKDGRPIFVEATASDKHHVKHLEMVFAVNPTPRDMETLKARAELLRVPEALQK